MDTKQNGFDQKIIEKYMENPIRGKFCPYCESANFQNTGAGGDFYEHDVFFECKDCHKRWVEYWSLKLVEIVPEEEEDE